MRRLSFFILGAFLTFAVIFSNLNLGIANAYAQSAFVYVGGISAGFTLKSGNVQIVGTCEVITENGVRSPAMEAGLRTGDRIMKINGIKVETITELNEIVDKSKGKQVSLEIERNKETFCLNVNGVKDKISNRYKIGILARDNVSGIGTLTYIDETTRTFGALGHSVVGENKRELKISDSVVYECSIVGVNKGVRGRAGELRGMFLSDKPLGNAEKLCDCGIFGKISKDVNVRSMKKVVADSGQAMPGNAYIYSTINGLDVKRYEIEIVKVDKFNKENKNYVIKIVDEDLISQTGGIVQGMSGSPILQDGRLIGAVTHVFLNDPTRGYGIDINTMLNAQ